MALVKCKECGTDVSDKATACVKCGAPIKIQKPKGKSGCGVVVLGFLVIGVVMAIIGSVDNKSSSTNGKGSAGDKPTEQSCAKDDLQCLGDKGTIAAGIYCKDDIERLATHSVKWTDGTFEMKFSRFRWADKAAGTITYIGDKAEFQNGFGAYTPVTYECDLASDGKSVLDVRAHEGRLPN